MKVPNLESMIEEVFDELSAYESAQEVMDIESSKGLEEARRIIDAAEKLNLLATKTTGIGVATWVIDTKSHPMRQGGSVTNASSNSLHISNGTNHIPPRLKAPLIPSTLGDKSSFKPGRHKKRAKS